MEKNLNREATVLALPQVRALSSHYNFVPHTIHNNSSSSKNYKSPPYLGMKIHRSPTVRSQNQTYLYQISHLPVK